MSYSFTTILSAVAATAVGYAIGYGFGALQRAALAQNAKKEADGKLTSGWKLMPSSGQRVAYLLLTLIAIQFLCPVLFADGIQWWVSGGLAAGYGWSLYRSLREKLAANRI